MAQQGNNQFIGWTYNSETHEWEMPELQAEFLQWLLTPPADRQPRHQREWAAQHDIHESTPRKWKRDPTFREQWDRALSEMNINPERVQRVIDALWKAATLGDTKAAVVYLQMVEKISPPKIVIEEESVQNMSDEKLEKELMKRAEAVRHA